VIVLGVTVGASGLVGVMVMVATLVVTGPLSAYAKKMQIQIKDASQRTLSVTRQILDGMKVIKMMGCALTQTLILTVARTLTLTRSDPHTPTLMARSVHARAGEEAYFQQCCACRADHLNKMVRTSSSPMGTHPRQHGTRAGGERGFLAASHTQRERTPRRYAFA
jgi:hypothetical protein